MNRAPRIAAALMALCAAVALLLSSCGPTGSGPRAALEERLAAEGRLLVLVPYGCPQGAASRCLRFDRAALADTPLYLRSSADPERYLFVGPDGAMEQDGTSAGVLAESGEIRLTPDAFSLYVDGRPILSRIAGWDIFWAGTEERPPAVTETIHPAINFADGFMRHELPSDSCQAASGEWILRQHGGGMPRDEEEAHDYSVQRAVNPFSVRGRDGVLVFGKPDWDSYLGEANVYFGVPPEAEVVDARTVPVDRDMLVAVGDPQGFQVGFGWFGAARAFALATRTGEGEWEVLESHAGRRPPLTNWMRLGLGVKGGNAVEAWLDGKLLISRELDRVVTGPFLLCSRGGTSEWDDVRVRSYPLPPTAWTPLCVRSANFADKQRKNNSDPRQFSEWARGRDAFRVGMARDPELGLLRQITTQQPLIGDWRYGSVAYASSVGEFPEGAYRFDVLPEVKGEPGTASEEPLAVVAATREGTGWTVSVPGRGEPLRVEGELALRRVAEDGNRLTVASDSGWVPLSEPVNGPLFLRINRAPSADRRPVPFPRAEHHALHCGHLVSDLFESVPADWSWIEGHCRMAARWACQNQWNFLACSGTGIPFMVSKRRYGGDQTHEYFMSMRPVTPSDSGDVSFHYDPTQDEKLQVFHEHRGWYNRRDLNFSFCSDGRNPLSGYAVVFGGEDNSVTRFYRQGKVLEQTESATFLFPPGPGHQDIHWRWWKMTIHKRGGHIRVLMDGRTLFDVLDPEPLPDGFVGFWTVRNGFSLAKVSSQAESIAWEPDVLYVDQDRGESPWHPLLTDSMALAPGTDGMTQVRLMVGGGFGALRYTCPAPVSLAESPQLRLPIRASDDVALTAFLETTAGDFLLDLGAGMEGMKSLATPSGEAGECFQLPTLTAEQLAAKVLTFTGSKDDAVVCDVRAELAKHGVQTDGVNVLSITLGRTANPGYALAGADGRNLAGTSYQVGEPVFGPSEAK